MDIPALADLLKQTIEDDAAFETAIYVASRYALLQDAEGAAGLKKPSVPNVSPEALRLVMQQDMGLTDNVFWMENYAALRAMMVIDDIEVQTKAMCLRHADDTGNKESKQVVRDLFTPRFQALTYIVLKTGGREKAKKFDFDMKRLLTLDNKARKYFANIGV